MHQRTHGWKRGASSRYAVQLERLTYWAKTDRLIKEEPSHDDWTREPAGALARFEDGAVVSKVSFPSDFSAIRVRNLPTVSSPASVAALLSGVALPVVAENVRVIAHPESATCTADITDLDWNRKLIGLLC